MGFDLRYLLDHQKGRRMLIKATERGLTLIELIVGIAIVSVVLALGIPSFSSMIQNTQVRSAGESILNGLNAARNEALRRNVNVSFRLTDTSGRIAWTVDCVVSTNDCPATPIQSFSVADGGANARVGISTATTTPIYTTALSSGAGLSSGAAVTFNNLGIPLATNPSDGTARITRIDLSNAVSADSRRLVIVLGTGGSIRMCDPLHNLATNPQGCTSP
jgi:type IV fimbrial biogenesis protein FimT